MIIKKEDYKWIVAWLIGLMITFTIVGILAIRLKPNQELTYKTVSLKNIKGLNDCKMFAIESDSTKLYVIRCPNSDVSVRWADDSVDLFTNTIMVNKQL